MSFSNNYNVALSGSDSSSDVTLFDATTDGGGVTTFVITNRATASAYAFINVHGLHPAGYYVPIAPGQTMPFRVGADGITKIVAHGAGAVVDGGSAVTI